MGGWVDESLDLEVEVELEVEPDLVPCFQH